MPLVGWPERDIGPQKALVVLRKQLRRWQSGEYALIAGHGREPPEVGYRSSNSPTDQPRCVMSHSAALKLRATWPLGCCGRWKQILPETQMDAYWLMAQSPSACIFVSALFEARNARRPGRRWRPRRALFDETTRERQRRPAADRPFWRTDRHLRPTEGGQAERRRTPAPLRKAAENGDATVMVRALAAEVAFLEPQMAPAVGRRNLAKTTRSTPRRVAQDHS
jgi:hypothetical protein